MKFWGITGTNGKTTTTWVAAAFINAEKGRKCGYVTTVEVNTGTRQFYTGYTTPPLNQLREIFDEMEANGCTDCVMEVSSHAIHQHRTGDTVFSGGAFTNLSEDHLDYHKTMEAYFDVKLDFARQIAAAHKTSPEMGRGDLPPYVVCLDGGYGREMYEAVGNLAVNVIPACNGTNGTDGTSGTCRTRPDYDLSQLQLVGDYNKSNVLTAAALAEAAGVSHATVQSVIPTLKPRWGRLELVENPNVAATVYVDFAHTPDGLEKVLAAVRGVMIGGQRSNSGQRSKVKGQTKEEKFNCLTSDLGPLTSQSRMPRLWIVFGAGGDRDPMKRPLMGAACARLADRLVVTSDNPRSEDPMKIIEAILEGVEEGQRSKVKCQDSGQRSKVKGQTVELDHLCLTSDLGPLTSFVHVEPDRRVAIGYALAHAAKGDVVVIAGKGHETTQEIKGVKHPFDDRAVVREWKGELA